MTTEIGRQGDLFFLKAARPGIIATIGINLTEARRLRDYLNENLPVSQDLQVIDLTTIPQDFVRLNA
jgi:hypothetical protein